MRKRWILLLLAATAAAEEPQDRVRCVRGSATIADAVEQVGGLLGAADAQSVVFVFEQIDFGEHERLPDEPDYHAQLAEWLEKVAAWEAGREERVRIALTGSSKPLAAHADGAILQQARRVERVRPGKWLSRLARFPKGKNGALVYVSGAPDDRRFGEERPEWDPEEVAAWLNRSGARLYVVMPEARFGDFLPVVEHVDLAPTWWCVPTARRHDRRFDSGLASWGTDCPSAYGIAGYARAAAATRGAYVFYPGRSSDWLDPCPFNVGLLTELLPRMPSAAELSKARETDPALREIAEATRRCAGLAAFESNVMAAPSDAKKIARLAGAARSNAELCAAEADRLAAVEAGGVEGASRRAFAQLRYSRFLLEMCAFHSFAWAEGAERLEAFVARGEGREVYDKSSLDVWVSGRQALRLRDVLAPIAEYGGTDELRKKWGKKRVEDLSQPLRERAARVVAAAENVMKHDGLSPWGWMVYYSEIMTFEPGWIGSIKGRTRWKPDSKGAENETPAEPPPAPGSGGSGPTTGG